MALLPLAGALVLLMVDSAIELAFISSMVGYLHRSGANQYPFEYQGTYATVHAKPAGLLLNQGHTSNGAVGTALVAIGFGGFLILWMQRQRERKVTLLYGHWQEIQLTRPQNSSQRPCRLFLAYTILTVLSVLLTLSALAYTFAVTNQTKGQTIDKTLAARIQGTKYPQDQWTPEAWTKAVLGLPVTSDKDAKYLRHWLRVMEGWKWNLIPMFLLGLLVASLSGMAYWQTVKEQQQSKQTTTNTRQVRSGL